MAYTVYNCCENTLIQIFWGNILTIVSTAVMVHNLNVIVPRTKHLYNHNKQNDSQNLKQNICFH